MSGRDIEITSIGSILRVLLMQSKLMLFGALGIMIAAIGTYFLSPKIYEVKSLLFIEPSSYRAGDDISSLLSGNNSGGSVANLITLYDTRSNIYELLNRLDLAADIYDEEVSKKINFKNFSYINGLEKTTSFTLEIHDDNDFSISKNGNVLVKKQNFGEILPNNNFSGLVSATDVVEKGEYDFLLYSNDSLINRIQAEIVVSDKNPSRFGNTSLSAGGLIEVTSFTSQPSRLIKVINEMNLIFIERDISAKSERARLAIAFLDGRLEDIENTLIANKNRLSRFQSENSSLNVDIETKSILDTLFALRTQLTEFEIEEAKFQGSYTQDNPRYTNLQTQKKIISNEINILQERIKSLPTAQQEYIDLASNVQISQKVFDELTSQKLNFSIMEASTLGSIKVIDPAYNNKKISPRLSDIILFWLFGVFILTSFAAIRGLYFSKITNPAELQDHGISEIPLIGVFPLIDEINNSYIQSMESLILNIDNLKKGAKKILITSATQANGKSFTALKLAERLAVLGKKVLIADFDMKRGKLHRELNLERVPPSYVANKVKENFDDLQISENLFVIPRMKGIKSSFEWFNSESFKNLISTVENKVDFIIYDSAPILSVSDTSILALDSDFNILLIRHDVTKPGEIKRCIQNLDQIGVQFDGIIYNAYQKPQGYYGYYEYYGNYSYQYYADRYLNYDYQYDEDE